MKSRTDELIQALGMMFILAVLFIACPLLLGQNTQLIQQNGVLYEKPTLPLTGVRIAGPISADPWSISLDRQVGVFAGSSITRGYNLTGAQLPNGGVTGAYPDVFCKSPWAFSHFTCWNTGVDGATSTMDLSAYTGGTSDVTTVPSAHSLSPAATCPFFASNPAACPREIFFFDLTWSNNDVNNGIPLSTSIANAQAIMAAAKTDGYYRVLITSPISNPTNATRAAFMHSVDVAAFDGVIPAEKLVSFTYAIPNQADATFYSDTFSIYGPSIKFGIHPNATGHGVLGAKLIADMTGNGDAGNRTSGFVDVQTTFMNGLNAIGLRSDTVNMAVVENLDSTAYSATEYRDNNDTAKASFGYGNGNAAVYPSQVFIDSHTGQITLGFNGVGQMIVSSAPAPTGACTIANQSTLGSDGHLAYCSGGTWVQRF